MIWAVLTQEWHYMDGWGMGAMMVFWIILLVVIIWLVIWLLHGGGWPRGQTPEEILRRRYARGEIDREQYLRVLEDIRRQQP